MRRVQVLVCLGVCSTGFTFTFKMHNITAAATTENADIVWSYVKNQTKHRWRKVRSDRGPDWTSTMLGKWIKNNGLIQQLAPPDANGQIGIAEGKIKSLNDRMRVLMVGSGAPPNLSFHAIEMINGFANRVGRKGLPSPLEATGGSGSTAPYPKADFGQLAITVEVMKAPKNKVSRHIECVYLGPDWNSFDGCILLRIDNGRIIHRRTAAFNHERPFLTRGDKRPASQTPLLRALEEFELSRKGAKTRGLTIFYRSNQEMKVSVVEVV